MEDAFYFGRGRLVSYNKFPDDNCDGTNVNVKKKGEKGVLYRMLSGTLSGLSSGLSGISNFQIYNKSILRYNANAATDRESL